MTCARSTRGHTLGEMMIVVALTTIVLASIVPVAGTLLRHQELATDYAEDLAQGTRVADRIAREIRTARSRRRRGLASQPQAGPGELLLQKGAGFIRIAVTRAGRAVLERFDSQEQLLGREDLGRVGGLELSPWSPVSNVVTFDVALPRRTQGAPPAYLSSSALLGGEVGP